MAEPPVPAVRVVPLWQGSFKPCGESLHVLTREDRDVRSESPLLQDMEEFTALHEGHYQVGGHRKSMSAVHFRYVEVPGLIEVELDLLQRGSQVERRAPLILPVLDLEDGHTPPRMQEDEVGSQPVHVGLDVDLPAVGQALGEPGPNESLAPAQSRAEPIPC